MRKQSDFDIAAAALGSIADNSADFEALFREPLDAHAQHSPVDLRDKYELIPRANIGRWQNNPRGLVDYDDVPQLRDDILSNRETGGGLNATGVEVPLIVRPHPTTENKYILMDGERRWMASEGTAITELPCLIRHVSEAQALEAAIRIDLNNEDWSPVQAGKALLRYMDGANKYNEPRGEKLTAKDFGVSVGFIKNRIRAAQATPELQHMVEARPDSMSHIEYLEQVENPRRRKELINQVLHGASVRAISQQVAEIKRRLPPPSHAPGKHTSLDYNLPPRAAFEGITKAGEYNPAQNVTVSRSVAVNQQALEPGPEISEIANQMAYYARRLLESGVEYSEVSDQVKSTLSAIAELKKRSAKVA